MISSGFKFRFWNDFTILHFAIVLVKLVYPIIRKSVQKITLV